MAITTARDLISSASRLAGVIDASETLENLEASDALEELNDLVASWNLDELWPFTKKEFSGNFEVGNPIISMGLEVGDTIQTRRPNRVRSVAYLIGSSYYPLRFIDDNSFDTATRTTTEGATPQFWVLRQDFPSIRIELYPIPLTAYEFKITTEISAGSYTLNDNIDLPDGFGPALRYELAVLLSGKYKGSVEPWLAQKASEYKVRAQKINLKPQLLSKSGSPMGDGGRYNIFSDSTTGGL